MNSGRRKRNASRKLWPSGTSNRMRRPPSSSGGKRDRARADDSALVLPEGVCATQAPWGPPGPWWCLIGI
jgi:hypothetical protein